MDEKTKDKIADVIGSIAAAPVFAGSKIVEAAHKIGEKSPALDSMGEDLGNAAAKAKTAISETAKKISESEATKKVKDHIEQMSYVDPSSRLKGAFDKTQMAVKDLADKAKDGIVDNAQKAKDGFAEFKETRQEKKNAVPEGFFEEDTAGTLSEQGACDPPGGNLNEGGKTETLESKIQNIGASVNTFVEKSAAVIEDQVEGIKGKTEDLGTDMAGKLDQKEAEAIKKTDGFLEKAAEKIDAVYEDVKESVEKLEDRIH